MTPKLEKKLVKDFPHVFYKEKPNGTPYDMFGLEVNDGWYNIIREGAAKLEPLIKAEKKKDPEAWKMGFFQTSQLKEKYGTMRWYLSSGTDEMYAITDEVEGQSATVCEKCGEPGKVRGTFWFYCACYEHSEKEHRDNLEILEAKYNKKQKEKKK